MRVHLSLPEGGLLAFVAVLVTVAAAGPVVPNPAHAHDFADVRSWLGIPCALDVLSNLAFAAAGLAGLYALRAAPADLSRVQAGCASVFFIGLLVTAAASSYYHWEPRDAGLAVDRAGMAIAFAGLLGLAVASRVSDRAGAALGWVVLVLGPAAAWHCLLTGNVLPWALVQFGGIALVLVLAFWPTRAGALHVRWFGVILAYGIAKLLEVNDHTIFDLSGGLISGHTFKHLVAAVAAVPVIAAVRGGSVVRSAAEELRPMALARR